MFYEIRHYVTKPGRREEWLRFMERTVIPFQSSKGMVITASFVDEEHPDGYVWIRRFEDEAHRVEAYAAVYESDRWVAELGPAVADLLFLDKSVVTRVVPTPRSLLR
ncbi:NIPSNAP family protein [Kitasatospora sp. NBC_01246]|uniref:NIPSNAP family protein n=1 Tax=Kitasatospora sp. NBC_01246 TaxID=2903570 RepID=UPI002E314061|nr:NIPSNAP family protein [Kitasatospora sp. NBC_01246]